MLPTIEELNAMTTLLYGKAADKVDPWLRVLAASERREIIALCIAAKQSESLSDIAYYKRSI